MLLTQGHQLLISMVWNEGFEAIKKKSVAVYYILLTDVAIPAEHTVNGRFHTLIKTSRESSTHVKIVNPKTYSNSCQQQQARSASKFLEGERYCVNGAQLVEPAGVWLESCERRSSSLNS